MYINTFKITILTFSNYLDIANFLSFVLPWIMSFPFLSNSSWLQQFQTWTSVIFVGSANFIVPLIIYLKCHKFRTEYNRDRGILNKHQRELLKAIHFHSREITKWVDIAQVSKPQFNSNAKKLKVKHLQKMSYFS